MSSVSFSVETLHISSGKEKNNSIISFTFKYPIPLFIRRKYKLAKFHKVLQISQSDARSFEEEYMRKVFEACFAGYLFFLF